MIGRASMSLVFSISLIFLAIPILTNAERWSRQVSNSEWIPLANPRSQQGHNQNPPQLPQIHQPLIPGSLPPELRQEYQQQLLQLQKTQESIQRLLVLQQQLKQQQQLLQGQAYLPNGIAESEENKQSLHQSAIANVQTLPELAPEILVPPQISGEARPPVYTSQNFREPQGETAQEQYEDYGERQPEDYRNSERVRGSQREKEKYIPVGPSSPENANENVDDGEEEIQVVYVPAETLAQRGHPKNQQRGRDRKQFASQDSRIQRPFNNQGVQESAEPVEREPAQTKVSPEDDAYAREFLQQLQREHEGTDRLLKEARQKELDRLRDERKEIQRQAKLQQAAVEREQEIQRQRDAEKKRKELAKLEEAAKQRELERIRAARERQRLEEIERSKKAQARANEEKRKQEEARQAEMERLAVLEKQKKEQLERTIAAQRELEKEGGQRLSHSKDSRTSEVNPQAQPLIRNQHNHQQHHQSGKPNRNSRIRNKPRQRQQSLHNNQDIDHFDRPESTTSAPLSPNQPPLAVYMTNVGIETRVIRISDVLQTLKDAKTIDVLDNVGQDAPQVFVGPSNLEVPSGYAKFDLPYLSSIENNRVERRVDKLPFFVAPLSFNPPPGYSKIPFPAPHIGSVVVNTLDSNIHLQSEENLEEAGKASLNPLIEPNSFSDGSNQGVTYSTTYESPTTPTYSNYRHEEPSSTPQYQSSPSYSTVEASGPGRAYRFQQQSTSERPISSGSPDQPQSRPVFHQQHRPPFQEESQIGPNHSSQYSDDSSRSTTPIYKRPGIETSFSYQQGPQTVSSTPVYQESYSQVREDPPRQSQLSSANREPQHREVVHRYQLAAGQRENNRGQEYYSQVDSGAINSDEDSLRGPTQYNLPAELPPIIPQLPGLVNSLLDEGEQDAYVNKQPSTTTTTTTTTTTEAPTTTVRSRGRHRGRVIATRPSTTTTTTLSPPLKSRDSDRTRRPFGRTRSRYTTTTEEYKDTHEPTKSKVAETTQRSYNHQESYRRTTKTPKFKSRGTEESLHSSRNQVHDVQAHEAASSERNPSQDSDSRLPEVDSNEPTYSQYNFASTTAALENYPVQDGDDARIENPTTSGDYSKNLNYPQARPSAPGFLRNQGDQISQQYQERFPTADYTQTSLEDAPVNGFNYQVKTTPTIPPTSRDFAYYQNKQESFDSSQAAPLNSQINDHQQRPVFYENPEDAGQVSNEGLARPQPHFSINEESNSGFTENAGAIHDPFHGDHQEAFRTTGLAPEHAPLEVTTETTTTSTTTEAPLIIRQRVRARLGGRGRPDSAIQTRPRGPQDEYVRFSAVNNQNTPTTERPTTRHRTTTRARPKTRQQYNNVQVQTEGNDYVRIQAPVRSYQKTIVTPPHTTRRTTTTPAPTTTTVAYESNDEIEYGFIRPPNFAPVQTVENRYENSFRPTDDQSQLQSVLPTDETAEDSSPSHTQVSRNRPKYQSPNRRPASKSISSTTLNSETSSYTEKPRTRVEEPKNNRVRTRSRKPGRRRTTTTTTTTTEYVLEENNDLPLEGNYPRPVGSVEDSIGQTYYEEKFEALPLASGGTRNPPQQNRENTFSGQDFLLNFGSEQGSPESDQSHLASHPSQKYGGSRLRSQSPRQGSQDRDIYGSESQWSTKLTSTSFQPSPTANRLPQDEGKSNVSDNEKYKYANDEAPADEPEIITAAPDDFYVTVLVSSDDRESKSAISNDAASMDAMEGTNFGMKTSTFLQSTTPTPVSQETVVPNSSTGISSSGENSGNGEASSSQETSPEVRPTRRMGGRRRRVRVRVRPAATDDFVTAESQHFNSAVNTLIQDRWKYNRLGKESKEKAITTNSPIYDETTTSGSVEKTIFNGLFDEIFKNDTIKTTSDSETITSDHSGLVTTTLTPPEDPRIPETTMINFANSETATKSSDESKIINSAKTDELSTNAPLMTTMTIPRKSWDSTKQYIDSVAMNSGEYVSNAKYEKENIDLDENSTGQGNEVYQNDYREKNDENTAVEMSDSDDYPKNHRSEWSEVRYPTDRGLLNYNRRIKFNSTKTLPGVITKTDGDTSVKTLSDYVKAIFDTMKNADEEKTESESDVISQNKKNVSSSTDSTTAIADSTTILPEIISTVTEIGTTDSEMEKSDNEIGTTKNILEKLEDNTEIPFGIGSEKTERPQSTETVNPTEEVEGLIEVSTKVDPLISSVSTSGSTENLNSSEATDATTTMESVPVSKNLTQTKLGAILRTSTTTKVSHMTEICYRGRCVMTKPKEEIRKR